MVSFIHLLFIYALISICYLYQTVIASTILATKCTDGIVIGTDGLTSSNAIFASNRSSKKIFFINKTTAICCAGDTTHFYHLYQALFTLQTEEEAFTGECLSVKSIANLTRKLVNKYFPKAHVIIAGVDEKEKGKDGDDYKLFEVLPSGTFLEQDVVLAGTGASLVSTLVEDLLNNYKEDEDKDKDKDQDKDQDNDEDEKKNVPDMNMDMAKKANIISNQNQNQNQNQNIYASSIASGGRLVRDLLPKTRRVLSAAVRLDPKSGGETSVWVLSKQTHEGVDALTSDAAL